MLSNQFQISSHTNAYRRYAFLFFVALVACALWLAPFGSALAQAMGGLDKGTNALQQFYDWLWLIVPIFCTIVGLIMGALYAGDLIRKETLWQYGGGVFFAGVIVGALIKIFF